MSVAPEKLKSVGSDWLDLSDFHGSFWRTKQLLWIHFHSHELVSATAEHTGADATQGIHVKVRNDVIAPGNGYILTVVVD